MLSAMRRSLRSTCSIESMLSYRVSDSWFAEDDACKILSQYVMGYFPPTMAFWASKIGYSRKPWFDFDVFYKSILFKHLNFFLYCFIFHQMSIYRDHNKTDSSPFQVLRKRFQ